MTGATAISLAYGVDVQDDNDPFVNMSQLAFDTALEASVPGAFLVDVIPWLKYVPAWVPGAGFQRKAKEWRKLQEDVHELPFATTAKKTVSLLVDGLSRLHEITYEHAGNRLRVLQSHHSPPISWRN